MGKLQHIETNQGRRLAFYQSSQKSDAAGVVFLGGFHSDMQGTKAAFLEQWAKQQGRAYLRFDYSGHGQSSGKFTDGCIGEWAQDAAAIIENLTEGPQILVGSSMGGWIALILAKFMPKKIAGLVGIAAAPDFTEDSMWAGFTPDQRQKLMQNGRVELPSEYQEPYVITQKLIEDGRNQLVLRDRLLLPFPTRFLQGTADKDVAQSVALRLLEHASGDDVQLLLRKGADHRFSSPECLALICAAIDQVSARRKSSNPSEKL